MTTSSRRTGSLFDLRRLTIDLDEVDRVADELRVSKLRTQYLEAKLYRYKSAYEDMRKLIMDIKLHEI